MYLLHIICNMTITKNKSFAVETIYLPEKRLPQGLPWALLTRLAPANPAAAPSRKLPAPELLPKILLLVAVFWPRVPPRVRHGLNSELATNCAATPAAAPAAPASMAWLPVKNLVFWPLLLLLLGRPNPNLVPGLEPPLCGSGWAAEMETLRYEVAR